MEDIFDFLTLKITATEFAAKIEADDHIINIIKTRIPDSKRFWDDVWDTSPLSGEAFHHDSYDLRKTLTAGYYNLYSISNRAEAYKLIYKLFGSDFPGIEYNPYYRQLSLISIDSVPDYIGGKEVDPIITEVIDLRPADLTEKKQYEWIRTRLKETFYIQKGKYPRWIQYADWPVHNGKPMRFIKQWHTGDLYCYMFEDEETGCKRVVEQHG